MKIEIGRVVKTSLAALIALAGSVPVFAETQTTTVAPGSHNLVKFAGDPAGLYQLAIQPASGYAIKDSDFTAEFKSTTLWQRMSKTQYNITYVEAPKPPDVSVEGTFETWGGGGPGPAPSGFLVDVRDECQPLETEIFVQREADGSYAGRRLHSAWVDIHARWKDPPCCACNVKICQNIKGSITITYTDNSAIRTAIDAYLLDSSYPGDVHASGTLNGKKWVKIDDQPSAPLLQGEENDTQEFRDVNHAEDFFMYIPSQGPPVSKMIVSWTATVVATRGEGGVAFNPGASSYDPSTTEPSDRKDGQASARPPVSQGITATEYSNGPNWKQISGGPTSKAAEYVKRHNSK